MERASQLIRSLRLPGNMISDEELACACWSHAVGKNVAKYTRAVRLVRTRLVVEVDDVLWRRQLMSLSQQILKNLAQHLGPGAVDDLEFRVVPRRIQPDRARSAAPGLVDEAEAIADPILRSIYKSSRSKLQA